uniref:Exostosin domain-containing protein n=1 Tax=Heterorhabditis bacteriophora TaxID=37862 RepID=A0A1I7WWS6_HETBA
MRSRTSVADDLLKLKWTVFVVNVGPTSSRTLVDSNTLGHGKGSDSSMHFMCCSAQFYLRSDDSVKKGTLSGICGKYYNQPGDWYKNQFKTPSNAYSKVLNMRIVVFAGDEFCTPSQRACLWCFAVDNTYPFQRLSP